MSGQSKDIDFALIAESMIENDLQEVKKTGTNIKAAQYSNLVPDSTPDVSKINLDESAVEAFISGAPIKTVKPKPVVKQQEKPNKSVQELTEELMSLINQAKNLLNEMTTCGSIGVATIEPTPKQRAKNKIKLALKKKLNRSSNGSTK